MPFASAISVRYGHAPSNVRASSGRPPSDAPAAPYSSSVRRLVGAAEAERVRRVGVAREQERAGASRHARGLADVPPRGGDCDERDARRDQRDAGHADRRAVDRARQHAL